jgi:hypothetical protein
MKLYWSTLVMRDRKGQQIGEALAIGKPYADRLACERAIEDQDVQIIENHRRSIAAHSPAEFTISTEMRTTE